MHPPPPYFLVFDVESVGPGRRRRPEAFGRAHEGRAMAEVQSLLLVHKDDPRAPGLGVAASANLHAA